MHNLIKKLYTTQKPVSEVTGPAPLQFYTPIRKLKDKKLNYGQCPPTWAYNTSITARRQGYRLFTATVQLYTKYQLLFCKIYPLPQTFCVTLYRMTNETKLLNYDTARFGKGFSQSPEVVLHMKSARLLKAITDYKVLKRKSFPI